MPLLQSDAPEQQHFREVGHGLDEVDLDAGRNAARKMLAFLPFRPVPPVLENWLAQDLGRLYGVKDDDYPTAVLKRFGIEYNCPAGDLAHVPAKGPAIVVANHPFGLVDGAVILTLLTAIRPDVRMLATSLLAAVPQLQSRIIPVDNFGGGGAQHGNIGPLRRSLQWLRAGGLLIVFPAGEVASFQFGGAQSPASIRDTEWNANAVRLAKHSGSPIVPAYFHGTNSPAFHLAGMVNAQLRTLLLPHELFKKTGTCIRVSIGAAIPAKRFSNELRGGDSLRQDIEYVRARTHVLQHRSLPLLAKRGSHWVMPFRVSKAQIVAPADASTMSREIEQLPPAQCLYQQAGNQVWIASAREIPSILHEIGRLREVTFRQAGEGTGTPLDLDRFDPHYQHLFIWNTERREIAGAYRMAPVDDVIRMRGTRGLYTGSLFHLDRDFYSAIQPALELGRSFVRIEYQKSYHALLLLWKGLGHYVAQNPQYRVLFGPVSISKEYCDSSRALMVSYLRERHTDPDLARFVHPRKEYRVRPLGDCSPRSFAALVNNLDELSGVIADIEPDRKGLPILLQHYLNLGGKILDFNIDKNFSAVLDGLIVVDLTKTNRRSLERYMGKASAQNYLHHHLEDSGAVANS